MEWNYPSTINVFYASEKCFILLEINFHALYAFTYNFKFSFLTFHKFLEPKRCFTSQMGSNACDGSSCPN